MHIAIAGIRGIPANYGGFETFAEELATRLVKRGHQVTVYGRSNNIRYPSRVYNGVRLVILPTIPTKHLDTVAHTCLSVFHALGKRYDAMLICNAANVLFSAVPRLAGTSVALNVDGIERKRQKWGFLGKAYYLVSEYLVRVVPTAVVTDAKVIHDYFLEEHGVDSTMIPYGADCRRSEDTKFIESLGLSSRGYLLYVSRLEPENNAHLVIEAYRSVEGTMPLVIVGDAPYALTYIHGLKAAADDRVRFTGAIYGEGYLALRSHAYAYIQATEVGGTHPALLEAMGSGNCVLAKETPEHREVLGDTGLYFETASDLSRLIAEIFGNPRDVVRRGEASRVRARELYSWDAVTVQYERLFLDMIQG